MKDAETAEPSGPDDNKGSLNRGLDLVIKAGEAAKSLVNIAKLVLVVLLIWLVYSFAAPIVKAGGKIGAGFEAFGSKFDNIGGKVTEFKDSVGQLKDGALDKLGSAKDRIFSSDEDEAPDTASQETAASDSRPAEGAGTESKSIPESTTTEVETESEIERTVADDAVSDEIEEGDESITTRALSWIKRLDPRD